MRQLLLDIGNTKLAAALAVDGQIVERHRALHFGGVGRPEAAVAEVHDWCVARWASGGVDAVGIASVEPRLLELWLRLWEHRQGAAAIAVHRIDHTSPLPYRIEIEEPHTIGADRLCNVAAAVRRGLSSAILIGLGTAHTFDVLEDGVFVGGLIGPGLEIAHRAMVARAARLPDIPLDRPEELIGRRTRDAMRSGSYYGGLGGVLYVLHRLLQVYPGAMVLATGGSVEILRGDLPADILVVPDLTLEGILAVLAAAPLSS